MEETKAGSELPTMPDVVAVANRWVAAQAEFDAAADTMDQERLDLAAAAYDRFTEEFDATVLRYAQRLDRRYLLAACEEALEDARERDEDLGYGCWPTVLAAIAKAKGE